jgi:metal-responsive CopG/Arc/MetJ family transcriptional regulator
MSHYSYALTDERMRMLDRLEHETDATTRAEAIDTAMTHYLEDKSNREEHWEEFPPAKLRLLNTSALKVAYYPKIR